MSVVIAHPTGNANSRNAALALIEAGLLAEFWTCIGWRSDHPLGCLLPAAVRCKLERRVLPSSLWPFVHFRPMREVGRHLVGRRRITGFQLSDYFSVDAVYNDLDRAVARRLKSVRSMRAAFAYEDGALESFRVAKRIGLRTIYDLPIGYWRAGRQIAMEERVRLPEWSASWPALKDSEIKLERKDEELRMADSVLVASEFTAETLKEAPFAIPRPIVIPYGCCSPSPARSLDARLSPRTGAPLRVLFVGSLSQRKGIYELFRAVDALGDRATLTLVGGKVGDCPARDRHLLRHRWISTLAHPDVLRLMREHDVFVFPSLFEGFGLVITEALSQGLPVITTNHTCGPDILTEGEDGFLVPIRDWQTIAARLELLDRDRPRLAQMQLNAQAAAARQPWERYRQGVGEAVRKALADDLEAA